MRQSARFQNKPIPWMYSTAGAVLGGALMKLHPIQRRLTELEIRNIQDYFNSDFISPERRRQLDKLTAFMMTYFAAIKRMASLSKLARQDYYALNRRGCFALKELPSMDKPAHPGSPYLPLVIVPGLNTPPMFFREMHDYFISQGYNVSVLSLPEHGLADVERCAQALKSEVERIRDRCEVEKVNVIGHCLGGLVGQYCVENLEPGKSSIQHLVALGTGFLGAEGVEQLKNIWIPNHPGKQVPKVFDQLIQWNLNVARKSTEVAYHNLLSIWDFMVHFRNGLLEMAPDALGIGTVENHIIDDPNIDHLTLVLHHEVFQRIEQILNPSVPTVEPVILTARG